MQAELFADVGAKLGEGPVWHAESASLIWVDIVNGLVHQTTNDAHTTTVWRSADVVSSIAQLGDSEWIVAERKTVSIVSGWETSRPLCVLPLDDETLRCNDGKLDPAGRFVVGTLDEAGDHSKGALYSISEAGEPTQLLSGVGISNGMAWSSDNETMYYIDTPTLRIDKFDFDVASGSVSNRRPVVTFKSDWGAPDGMTLAADGSLWVACWGGGAVRQFLPDGSAGEVVQVAARNPTSCVFADSGELFITTASIESPGNVGDGALWVARP